MTLRGSMGIHIAAVPIDHGLDEGDESRTLRLDPLHGKCTDEVARNVALDHGRNRIADLARIGCHQRAIVCIEEIIAAAEAGRGDDG
jgi:hypothetical protein